MANFDHERPEFVGMNSVGLADDGVEKLPRGRIVSMLTRLNQEFSGTGTGTGTGTGLSRPKVTEAQIFFPIGVESTPFEVGPRPF